MDKTYLAGVIGYPIKHSLSPLLFEFLSKKLKTPVVYLPLAIKTNELKTKLKNAKDLCVFSGVNVTIPHKEKVIKHVDRLTPTAKSVGAVNLIHFKNQTLIGDNSDVYGIKETLKEHKISLRGKSVILYGAGGAAKAVCTAVAQLGAKKVWIQNRTTVKSTKLCRFFSRQFTKTQFSSLSLNKEPKEKIALYVNATPLGMQGFPKKSPLTSLACKNAFAFDLVYRPESTVFLRDAKKQGLQPIGGLDMLIWQAIASWELWFGKVSQRQKLKKALSNYIRKKVL